VFSFVCGLTSGMVRAGGEGFSCTTGEIVTDLADFTSREDFGVSRRLETFGLSTSAFQGKPTLGLLGDSSFTCGNSLWGFGGSFAFGCMAGACATACVRGACARATGACATGACADALCGTGGFRPPSSDFAVGNMVDSSVGDTPTASMKFCSVVPDTAEPMEDTKASAIARAATSSPCPPDQGN